MTAENWTGLAEQALWPAVVLMLGLVLRKPMAAFLNGLADWVTKVSVMSVSIELAVAQSADPPWRGIGGDAVRGLVVAQQVNDSYFSTLRAFPTSRVVPLHGNTPRGSGHPTSPTGCCATLFGQTGGWAMIDCGRPKIVCAPLRPRPVTMWRCSAQPGGSIDSSTGVRY
jgi:hypothetical protein